MFKYDVCYYIDVILQQCLVIPSILWQCPVDSWEFSLVAHFIMCNTPSHVPRVTIWWNNPHTHLEGKKDDFDVATCMKYDHLWVGLAYMWFTHNWNDLHVWIKKQLVHTSIHCWKLPFSFPLVGYTFHNLQSNIAYLIMLVWVTIWS